MKMRLKIMLCFFVCLAVAMGVLLWVVGVKTRELGVRITSDTGIKLVESCAREVGSWFAERIGEMRVIGEFYAMDYRSEAESLRYLAGINDRMERYYGNNQYSVFRVDASGFGWSDSQTAMDLLDQPYFQQALSSGDEITISTPLVAAPGTESSIAILSTLQGSDPGYLVAFIPAQRVEKVVSELDTMGSTAWIMDEQGALIAEDANHVHGQSACPRDYSLRALAKSIAQKQNSGMTVFETPDGRQGRLFYSGIEDTPGWILAVWMPDYMLLQQVASVTQTIILVGVGVFLLGALLSLRLSGSLTRPIRQLRKSMDAVEQGIPDAQVQIRGSDEIAALGRSYNEMIVRVRNLLDQAERDQKEKNSMQLKLLQAQINPHFVYNTLDMLRYKALDYHADEVAEITSALSAFFRISLSQGREFITLNEEAEHAYLYLYLQQRRYSTQLSYDIRLADGLEDCIVPKLVLQPLIENALMHGLKPSSYHGHIAVDLQPQGRDQILIRVSDDGVGISLDRQKEILSALEQGSGRCGFGLYNVHQRLILAFGPDCGLHMESASGRGTTVWFYIPAKKGEGHEG